MGMFLTMTGVANIALQEVRAEVEQIAQEVGSPLEESHDDDSEDQCVLCESASGHVTVVWPDQGDWDFEMLAQRLSERLRRPALGLHIHDDDLWMYLLYSSGKLVDKFNPLPDYWGELEEEDMASWGGRADVVCEHWPSVSKEAVSKYLRKWDFEDTGKAYPDDEFEVNDCWQLVDFMRRLGLDYPDPGNSVINKVHLHSRRN